jgi:hypothetical protein
MANPIIKRFRDDTGKVFEITEIIGDEVIISHEIHGEKVVLSNGSLTEMFSRLTNVSQQIGTD